MNVFPIEPKFEIGKVGFGPDANGHSYDLLNRSEFGKRLTDLVDRTEQPLVIALDGPWGSGKSHFLKLWAGAHKLELGGKAEVIYFDAFEHDFLDDPLVSLIGRLADEAAPRTWGAAAVESLKKSAFPLVKMVSRVGLAVATYGATEIAKPVVDVAIAKISDTTDEAIGQFWENETSRIKAMQGFREALETLTKKADNTTQKIVFIIDELDRCRPDYALQMLEIIKHFFTVPNVHFVLGANLTELENSVRARYGAGINARKYLQKFVMLEMRLPEVVSRAPTWSAYLQTTKSPLWGYRELNEAFTDSLSAVSKVRQVTIRDMQRIITIASLGQSEFFQCDPHYFRICVDLVVLSVLSPRSFQEFRSEKVLLRDLQMELNVDLFGEDFTSRRCGAWASLLAAKSLGFADIEFLKTERGIPYEIATKRWLEFQEKGGHTTWRDLHHCIERIFDTFTLPTP